MTQHCSGSESKVSSIEASLIKKGYHQSYDSNEKNLKSFEYIKSSYQGSEDSFEGETTHQITWGE